MSSHRPLILLLAAALSLTGCAGMGSIGTGGGMRSTAVDTGNTLAPNLRTIAYNPRNPQEADVYLTDFTPAQLDTQVAFDELSGSIIHLRIFLRPRAGRTPIERTASTAIVRHAVFANGAVGVYGGGGFIFPRGRPGDRSIGGSFSGATLQLVRASGDFNDLLGAAELSGGFRAPLNPELAEQISALLADAERFSESVQPSFVPEFMLGEPIDIPPETPEPETPEPETPEEVPPAPN